jgi:hypothetical protein
MRKKYLLALGVVFLMILVSVSAWAVMPTVLSYQGKLTDTAGVPVADGNYDMKFLLYDDVSTGTNLWEEQQTVSVADGIYSVHLGYTTAFSTTFFKDNDDLYLEVQVYNSSTTSWEILSPRQQVVCSAFSMKAQYAEKAIEAIDGAITTVMLAPDAVTEEKIQDDTVTAADIKDYTVTAVDIQDGEVLAKILNEDGSGTGLDADMLDGMEASAFMASGADNWVDETGDTMTGNLSVQARVSATNNGTTYAGEFYQPGPLNNAGALYARTNNGKYGEYLYNGGGYTSGETYGLYASTFGNSTSTSPTYGVYSKANDSNSPTYGFYSDTDSANSTAYGAYLDVDSGAGPSEGPCGLRVESDNNNTSGGPSWGILAKSYATKGIAMGINAWTENGSATDAGAYGIYNQAHHNGSGPNAQVYGMYNLSSHYGTSGQAFGIRGGTFGSDTGDAYGLYISAFKGGQDTAGTAYGGHFIADNDMYGGTSYGLYTKATGSNGPRYGLYSEVTASATGSFNNYGVFSEASNSNGGVFGFWGDVDSTSNYTAYGQYLHVYKPSGEGGLYGNSVYVDNDGTTGLIYGIDSIVRSSDSGSAYGGRFRTYDQASTDSGARYGVYAETDNNTSSTSYALYANGGDYAGYFYGNVHVVGTLSATSKPFIQPHKSDPSKEIVYVSLEGPEHAVFIRGNATLKKGKAVINLPEEWQQVAAEEGITVNLTPLGGWAPLYAKSVSKSKVVVRVAKGGDKNASFSYYIMAKRDGFQEHKPIRENKHFTADGISAWQFEKRYEEDTLESRAISSMLKSNGILNADGKLNESTARSLGWKVVANEKAPNYLATHGLIRTEDSPEKQSPRPRPSHPEPEKIKPSEQKLKLSRQ